MISTVESQNSSIRVVELPKSDRKVAPVSKEPVALTGKATDEIEGIKALETMFKAAVVGYARKFHTLREAIETCKAAGVSDAQMKQWATEVGYSIQTFANVMTNRQGGRWVYWIDNRDTGGRIYLKPEAIARMLRRGGYQLVQLT